MHSVRTALAAIVSLVVARLFGLPEAYWAPITTVVITETPSVRLHDRACDCQAHVCALWLPHPGPAAALPVPAVYDTACKFTEETESFT